jgi:predicted dehydrogenase
MQNNISVFLSGIGGYGNNYVKELLKNGTQNSVYIEGVADPHPESCAYLGELNAKGIPVYNSMESFYAEHKADLAIISSPIQFHCEQTCLALAHGSHVLCEKPIAATVQEARQMIEARNKAKRILAIGFQWAYDPVYQSLKKDIIAGRLEQPKRLKTLVLWPRDTDYYSRGWAGKRKDQKGRWVLDSVANNATAHYLHNMLFVLGKDLYESVRPLEITAELYRANAIENFDTSAMRISTGNGAEILFYASHAVKESIGPMFCYEFENASVYYNHPSFPKSIDHIVAVFRNNRIKDYGRPDHHGMYKLWTVIDAIRNGTPVPCPPEAALPHTLCINGAHQSMPNIVNFPSELIIKEGQPAITHVKALENVMIQCFDENKLPSETGIPWAKSGKPVSLSSYDRFDG